MASQQELTHERNRRFLALLKPVYRDCQRWAFSLTQNIDDAEDVLAQSVMTALEHIHQLKTEAAFKTWMFRIIVNTHRLMLRQLKRTPEPMEQEKLERMARETLGSREGQISIDESQCLGKVITVDASANRYEDHMLIGSTMTALYDPAMERVISFGMHDLGSAGTSVTVTMRDGDIDPALLDPNGVISRETPTMDLATFEDLTKELEAALDDIR